MTIARRALLAGFATFAGLGLAGPLQAQGPRRMVVHKDPQCGCCDAWVDHVRAAGFAAETRTTSAINRVKGQLGVPSSLWSCHTAEIDGYVIEGHVPAAEVLRLLAERPAGAGLAVAGMPIGSPGMEVSGTPPETYDVILFGPAGNRVFARYRGAARA